MTTPVTITDQVAEFQRASAGRLPAQIADLFAAEARKLKEDGEPEGIAPPGAPMPDGELLDVAGQATTLGRVMDGKAAVVVFYRGAWCPYCDIVLRTYQAQLVPALADRGVGLIAISPQKPDGSLSAQETKELTFTVLSDPGNQIASQLGILTGPTDAVREAQAGLGLDLTQVNADGTAGLPMPAVVIVDAAGIIRWIDVHADYTTRTEPAQVLQAVTGAIG